MSDPVNMIIRVQCEQGTKRFQVTESDCVSKLLELAAKEFNLDLSGGWVLSRTRKPEGAFKPTARALIRNAKLK